MKATLFETILTGVFIFVLGQIVVKLFIDPINQLKKTIAEVNHALSFYARIYMNPGVAPVEENKEASSKLRAISCQLMADVSVIPLYRVMAFLFGLPAFTHIDRAASNLIGISNFTVLRRDNDRHLGYMIRRYQQVSDDLGIYIPPREKIPDETINAMINPAD